MDRPKAAISNDETSTKDSQRLDSGMSSLSASGERNDQFVNPSAPLLPSSSEYSATPDVDPPPYSSVVQEDSSPYAHHSVPRIGWDRQFLELPSPLMSKTPESLAIPSAPIDSTPKSTTRGKPWLNPENENTITSQPSRYSVANNRTERSRTRIQERQQNVARSNNNNNNNNDDNCIGCICEGCCIIFCESISMGIF